MAYDTYPAVDENYRFPPEIREASAKGTTLTNDQDLNTVTSSGLYRAELGSVAVSIQNRPEEFRQPFTVSVRWISEVNGILIQEASMKVSGEYRTRQFYRVKFGTNWGDWIDLDFQRPQKSLPNTLAVVGTSESEGPAAWVGQLAPLSTATITNFSRSGDDSNSVAIRCGALAITGTVAGGVIPTSGSVSFVSDQKLQLRTNRIISTGMLSGIAGTITHIANDTYTFTRESSGAAKTVSGTQEFVSSFSTTASTVIVIMGGNDFNQGVKASDGTTATQVLGNYYRIVEHLESLGKTVLVCGVTTRATTPPGSVGFDEIMEINRSLYSRYPGHYIDRQGYLSQKCIYDAGLTPTAADLTAIKNGDIPPQLRIADGVHETDLAQTTIARYFMLPWLSAAGVITPKNSPSALPTLSPNFYRWGSNDDHNHDDDYYTKAQVDADKIWNRGQIPGHADFNTYLTPGTYRNIQSVAPNQPYPTVGTLEVFNVASGAMQRYTTWESSPKVYIRRFTGTSWNAWVVASTRFGEIGGTWNDLDTLTEPGHWGCNTITANGQPVKTPGHLEIMIMGSYGVIQRYITYEATPREFLRRRSGSTIDTWQPWVELTNSNKIDSINTEIAQLKTSGLVGYGSGSKIGPLSITLPGGTVARDVATGAARWLRSYSHAPSRVRLHISNRNPGTQAVGAPLNLVGAKLGIGVGNYAIESQVDLISPNSTIPASGNQELVGPWVNYPGVDGDKIGVAIAWSGGGSVQFHQGGGWTREGTIDNWDSVLLPSGFSKSQGLTPFYVWLEAEFPARVPFAGGMGDSITVGTATLDPVEASWLSLYALAENAIPVFFAQHGSNSPYWVPGNYRWTSFYPGLSVNLDSMIKAIGRNDIFDGVTEETLRSRDTLVAQAISEIWPRTPQFITTITPYSAETVGMRTARKAHNLYRQSLPNGERGVFDFASAVGNAEGTALAPEYSADGLHPNAAGQIQMGNRVIQSPVTPYTLTEKKMRSL